MFNLHQPKNKTQKTRLPSAFKLLSSKFVNFFSAACIVNCARFASSNAAPSSAGYGFWMRYKAHRNALTIPSPPTTDTAGASSTTSLEENTGINRSASVKAGPLSQGAGRRTEKDGEGRRRAEKGGEGTPVGVPEDACGRWWTGVRAFTDRIIFEEKYPAMPQYNAMNDLASVLGLSQHQKKPKIPK